MLEPTGQSVIYDNTCSSQLVPCNPRSLGASRDLTQAPSNSTNNIHHIGHMHHNSWLLYCTKAVCQSNWNNRRSPRSKYMRSFTRTCQLFYIGPPTTGSSECLKHPSRNSTPLWSVILLPMFMLLPLIQTFMLSISVRGDHLVFLPTPFLLKVSTSLLGNARRVIQKLVAHPPQYRGCLRTL